MSSEPSGEAPNASKKRRNAITDKQRLKLRQHLHENPKASQAELAYWFESTYHITINQSTVSKILSSKYKYLDKLQLKGHGAKRNKKGLYPGLEVALFDIHQLMQARGVPITRKFLMESAKGLWSILAEYNGQPWPDLGSGWLTGFQGRYNIRQRAQHGELASVPKEAEDQMAGIREIVEGYANQADIYNMDESGLWWKAMPDKSLTTERLAGRKKDKARITTIVCSNSDGSHKLPIWIIGKVENPRAFGSKNHKLVCQPIVYKANAKAWVTQAICMEWLRAFAYATKKPGRQVLLLWDNHSAHVAAWKLLQDSSEFGHIKVVFLPPNSTARYQPLDQGIIQAFKAHYKSTLLSYMVTQALARRSFEISLLTAVQWVASAWALVTPITIQNCFVHSTIFGPKFGPVKIDPNYSHAAKLAKELEHLNLIKEAVDIKEFLDPQDEEVEDIQDLDLIQFVAAQYNFEPEEEIPIIEPPKVLHTEALQALETLQIYEQQQEESLVDFVAALNKHQSIILLRKTMNLKQLRIDSWLQ